MHRDLTSALSRPRFVLVSGALLVAAMLIPGLAPEGSGLGVAPLAAQSVSDLDYEDLFPRGLLLGGGLVRSSRVQDTEAYWARLDLGFAGPGVRVTAGASHWRSQLAPDEVARFERRLADLILDEVGTRPSIDLGEINWSNVALSVDAHALWRIPGGVLSYAGIGGTAHVMRGSGAAIDDTFIQDLLNTIRAGANLHAGLEVPVTRRIRVVGESRLEWVQSVTHLGFRAGLQYTWGALAPGEGR
jgi:hypothetical protein